MTLSNHLTDYVSGKRAMSLSHTVFPELTTEEMDEALQKLASATMPMISGVIHEHIESLPIAPPHKPIVVDVLPADFPSLVAILIDQQCPDWNIVQKATVYMQYMHETRLAAQKEYMQRTRDVHTEESRKRGQHAKPVEGSDDPGEFDIKEPERPGLN